MKGLGKRVNQQPAYRILTCLIMIYVTLQITLHDYSRGNTKVNGGRRRLLYRQTLPEIKPELAFTASPLNDSVPEEDYFRLARKVESRPTLAQASSCPSNVNLLRGHLRARKGFLTLGLTTVPRENAFYLPKCLDSLITQMSDEEKKTCVIVIFLGSSNKTWVNATLTLVDTKWNASVNSGLIQVVQPDFQLYPNISKTKKRNFNDSLARVHWRTKQNVDFATLFAYSENLSEFYIHIEDDVIAAKKYISDIRTFLEETMKRTWFVLHFSSLGFIGKLFHSEDLCMMHKYLMMFRDEKPCDMLIQDLRSIKTQHEDIRSRKALFQHFGKSSSLKGKVQTLIDRNFKDNPRPVNMNPSINKSLLPQKLFQSRNPRARIHTSMTAYKTYTRERPYSFERSGFFWTRSAKQGDYYRILFLKQEVLSMITVITGLPGNRSDTLQSGLLQIGTKVNQTHCLDTTQVAYFISGRADIRFRTPKAVHCVGIVVTRNQTTWMVINEIHIAQATISDDMGTDDRKKRKKPILNRKQRMGEVVGI